MAEKSTFKEKIIPKGPKTIAEPEKELRFTRITQALLFYGIGVIMFTIAMSLFILSTQDWDMSGPLLPIWAAWLCIPLLALCFISFRVGLRCTRHAYIILNPLGIEIFPFSKPEKNLQLIYWSEVADAEVSHKQLILHFNEEKKSGIVASLAPIPKKQRILLREAVLGVLKNRNK